MEEATSLPAYLEPQDQGPLGAPHLQTIYLDLKTLLLPEEPLQEEVSSQEILELLRQGEQQELEHPLLVLRQVLPTPPPTYLEGNPQYHSLQELGQPQQVQLATLQALEYLDRAEQEHQPLRGPTLSLQILQATFLRINPQLEAQGFLDHRPLQLQALLEVLEELLEELPEQHKEVSSPILAKLLKEEPHKEPQQELLLLHQLQLPQQLKVEATYSQAISQPLLLPTLQHQEILFSPILKLPPLNLQPPSQQPPKAPTSSNQTQVQTQPHPQQHQQTLHPILKTYSILKVQPPQPSQSLEPQGLLEYYPTSLRTTSKVLFH